VVEGPDPSHSLDAYELILAGGFLLITGKTLLPFTADYERVVAHGA
jgi:hypothetical protein